MKRFVNRSGYSPEIAEALLEALFSELTTKKLRQLLRAELGDPAVLDSFRKGVRAHGPKLITHIFASNVPNPGIISFILGMLVKSVNVGKVSSKDAGILDIYLASLREHDTELAKTNLLIRNRVGAPARPVGRRFIAPVHHWIKKSDLVVAYGSNETLEEIKKMVPTAVQFVGYGHRVSFSIYTREAVHLKDISRLAANTAKDIWMMDQRGCLSPTVIYVERGGEVSPFLFAKKIRKHLIEKGRWTVLFSEKWKGFPFAPTGKMWDMAITAWRELKSDPDAVFDREIIMDAAEIEPQVTWGTSPEMVSAIGGVVPDPDAENDTIKRQGIRHALEYMGLKPGMPITDIRIDKVFLGSCTNARIEDLRHAASIIGGRRIAPNIKQALVVPGSGLVRRQAEKEGLDRIFIAAGFEWREPGCSMCLGMNPDRLSPGERCASTSNRNFEGRQGQGGRTHLVSPAMAAAAAISGHFVDVRKL